MLHGPAGPAAGQAADTAVFDVAQLAPGVYVAEVRPRPPAYAFANSFIVIGERGVLVADTQQSPTAARALIATIRRLTQLPVRWVVNTHWHADHVAGNIAYRQAFPTVEFIAHANTAADLAARGQPWIREQIAELPARIEERRRWLREGRRVVAAARQAVCTGAPAVETTKLAAELEPVFGRYSVDAAQLAERVRAAAERSYREAAQRGCVGRWQ